jgi:hypothetical protein
MMDFPRQREKPRAVLEARNTDGSLIVGGSKNRGQCTRYRGFSLYDLKGLVDE